MAEVSTPVTSPQSCSARIGPDVDRGDPQGRGPRPPSSTQATSSSVCDARRARSAARCPAASSTRSRRDRFSVGSWSPASRCRLAQAVDEPSDPPGGRARTVAMSGSAGRWICRLPTAAARRASSPRFDRRFAPALGAIGRRDALARPWPEHPGDDVGEIADVVHGRGPRRASPSVEHRAGRRRPAPGTGPGRPRARGSRSSRPRPRGPRRTPPPGAREDRAAAGQVGAVEVGVDDDHVGVGGPGPGVLGEAVPARTGSGRRRGTRGRWSRPWPRPGSGARRAARPGRRWSCRRPSGPGGAPGRRAVAGSDGSASARRRQGVVGIGRVGRRRATRVSCSPAAADLGDPLDGRGSCSGPSARRR